MIVYVFLPSVTVLENNGTWNWDLNVALTTERYVALDLQRLSKDLKKKSCHFPDKPFTDHAL